MAKRPAFCMTSNQKVIAKQIEFKWISGMSFSQKQKNADSLLESIKKSYPSANPLEVSTKGRIELGSKMSAFNLKYQGYFLENIFQSSKIFENGGAYKDLLHVTPKEAKLDERLKTSGALKGFSFNGVTWRLEPKTAFYDFIYIQAVKESLTLDEIQQIKDYNRLLRKLKTRRNDLTKG